MHRTSSWSQPELSTLTAINIHTSWYYIHIAPPPLHPFHHLVGLFCISGEKPSPAKIVAALKRELACIAVVTVNNKEVHETILGQLTSQALDRHQYHEAFGISGSGMWRIV